MRDLCEAHFWAQANNKALSLKHVKCLAGQPKLPKPKTFLPVVNVALLMLLHFALLCSAPPSLPSLDTFILPIFFFFIY